MDTHLTETRPEDERHNLAEILVSRGQCDLKTIERARQVADENGQTLESVLVQLGLVGERGLAEAYGAMLGLPVVAADGYPAEAVIPDRLKPAFLRHARVIPVAAHDGTLVLAMADPLDSFTPAAVAAATGCAVIRQVAIPIELEHALDRLYPETSSGEETPHPE